MPSTRASGQRFEVVREVGDEHAQGVAVDSQRHEAVEKVGGGAGFGDGLELVDEHQCPVALGQRRHNRAQRRFEDAGVERRVPTVEHDRVDDADLGGLRGNRKPHRARSGTCESVSRGSSSRRCSRP